jgi:hypothetical protein
MSIDYENVENGLPKAEKNGLFFPRSFFAYDWSLVFGFLGFGVLGIMSSRVMKCKESRIEKSRWD